MKVIKKALAVVLTTALCAGMITYLPTTSGTEEVNAAVSQKVNVGVDFNGTDNRAECRHATFEDWIVEDCQSESYEAAGLKFTVSNATEEGKGSIVSSALKNLVNAEGTSPVLTLDGLRCTAFQKGAIKLEIEGLPAGTHSITSWHSFHYLASASTKRSTMTVKVNGTDIATGVEIPVKAKDDNEAAIVFGEFEVEEGQTVEILFVSDQNASTNNVPILNAFEIDGVHPLKSIKDVSPVDGDTHFEVEDGLSWTAAEGATAHRLFIGADEFTLENASRDFPEYQGEITETSFDLSKCQNIREFDHMKTYYWRVDEVYADGNVVKGKVYSFKVAHLAFPGAEGYGRYANGGRGGQVLEVTTLEDGYVTQLDEAGNPVLDETGAEVKVPIEGSLRWAIESFTGPRIVVFKVGGVIALTDQLVIDGTHGDIYIAGQTAPGDGITLINFTFGAMGASDVIIRNVRVRVGDYAGKSMGGMGLAGSDNSIIDHCSISWATDEGFSSRNAKNITFQRNIIAESLNNSVHYAASDGGSTEDREEGATERHSFAASIGGEIGSFHHNLLINNTGRNWSMAGGVESDGKTYGGVIDIRYNVVYNWQNRTTDGGARRVQFVGNYYKMGAVSNDMDIFYIDGDELDSQKVKLDEEGNPVVDENGVVVYTGDWQQAYLEGNKMIDRDGNTLLDPVNDDPWKKAATGGKNMEDPSRSKSSVPFFESYITKSTADEAYASVIADVGAKAPEWDYLDDRYIDEVTNNKYTLTGSKDNLKGIIDSQEDAGGYPTEEDFKGGEAPVDTDHDGMPDEWEIGVGLNPENPADGKAITLVTDGYTNLEVYLSELMNDPISWVNGQRPTPAPTEVPVTLGDVNDDGDINAEDALAVLKHAAKLQTLEGTEATAADVDENGNINATDALQILKKAAKLIEEFEKAAS